MKIKTIITFFVIFILCSTAISVSGLKINTTKEKIEEKNEQKIGKSGDNCAFFIAGSGTIDWPSSGAIFERVATNAKNMFDSYGNYKTWIKIKPNRRDVKDVIENQIPNNLGNNKQIFIYIGAHGDIAGSLLMKFSILLLPISVSTYDLSSWINNMESKLSKKGISYSYLTIVIESCYGGQHISSLSKNKRIVITSTDHDSSAYGNDAGEMYFSDTFFGAISNGESYGRAWEVADQKIDNMPSIRVQNPQLEDTGNQKSVGTDDPDILPIWDGDNNYPNAKDGKIAKNYKPNSKAKVKYKQSTLIKFPILQRLFPDLFKPREIGY